MNDDSRHPKRPHLLRTLDSWIARAEGEGTPEGDARAAQRRTERTRIETAMADQRMVWIGMRPEALEPISSESSR